MIFFNLELGNYSVYLSLHPQFFLSNFKLDFSFQGQNHFSRLFCFVELSHKMAILHIVMGTFKTGCPFHTMEKTKQNHKSTAREITA